MFQGSFFEHHSLFFKNCTKFPIVGLKAVSFSGDKSMKLSTQFLANCRIGKTSIDINVIVVLRLIKPLILGIDALCQFKVSIATHRNTVHIGLTNETIDLLSNPKNTGGDNRKVVIPGRDGEILINITELDIDNKVTEIEGISLETRAELRKLLFDHRHIFDEKPGRFRSFMYNFTLLDNKPYFNKSYPIPFQHREKVDREIRRMIECDIIERSKSPYINPTVPVIKRDGSLILCFEFTSSGRS